MTFQVGDDPVPILPTHTDVLFPGAVVTWDGETIAIVDEMVGAPVVAIFCQRGGALTGNVYRDVSSKREDLHVIGCAARVLKVDKAESGGYSLILQGLARIRLEKVVQEKPYFQAKIAHLPDENGDDETANALSMILRDLAKDVIGLMPELPKGAGPLVDSTKDPGALVDLIVSNLDAPFEERAALLQVIDVKDRLCRVIPLLSRQLEILEMRAQIDMKIREQLSLDLEASGHRPAPDQLRRMIVELQRTFLEEAIGRPNSPPNDSPTTQQHRIELKYPLVSSATRSLWSALRLFLHVSHTRRMRECIVDQLAVIRFQQRSEVLHQQLKAVITELER